MSNDLIIACAQGSLKRVKSIIRKYERNKSEIHTMYKQFDKAFNRACYYVRMNIIEYLLEYSKIHNFIINMNVLDCYAIRNICYKGKVNILKRLIEYGEYNNIKIELNCKYDYLFRITYTSGNCDCMKYILEYYNKYNLNITSIVWNSKMPFLFRVYSGLKYHNIKKLLIIHCKQTSNNFIKKLMLFSKHNNSLQYLYIKKQISKLTKKCILNNNLIDVDNYKDINRDIHYIQYILLL